MTCAVVGVAGKEVEKEGATMVLKCSLKNENFYKGLKLL
jgi:hypothetical protein